jgi:hypothetical protein
MEMRRRLRKNKIINDIREAEIFIKRSNDTIGRIKNSQMGETYVRNQIIKLKSLVEERVESLKELNINLVELSTGYLDEVIEEEYKQTERKVKSQRIEKDKIRAEKNEEKQEKKDLSQKYWKGIITSARSHRQKERDVKYAYKYVNKVVDSLPPYMVKNLSEMPNNKGYIWRGVHLYGDLPDQRGPRVMFEKKRGNILVIHEHTDLEYRRYEKNGKNRKQLVHKERRKIKSNGINLMDYIVKRK